MEESLAYTLISIVGDFGGYLGILMGASILSVYDFLLFIFHKVFKFGTRIRKQVFFLVLREYTGKI